jgi:hypothetical protein
VEPSVFLEFHLPNSATWLYFSLILTVTLFFQFSRPASVRNLDLLTLFLLAPGFLLLQEAHALIAAGDQLADPKTAPRQVYERGAAERIFAYSWLLTGSAYWFARAMADLAMTRRPVTSPNLNTAGLGWLGLALFVCLSAVAVQRTGDPVVPGPVGTRPIPIEQFREGTTAGVQQTLNGSGQASPADVRFWVERSLAMACHLAVALGLLMIGLRHFQDLTTGMALATLYLLLPYTAFHIGQFHLVWPAAFVTWAVFCYRRPVVSGWLLGLAAGSAFVPLLLFPLWAGFYARRGAGRFTAAFLAALGVSLGVLALALWWDGWLAAGLTPEVLAEWLPWKRARAESLWTGVHGAYRLPIFVLYVAFVGVISVWPAPKNLSHLVALSAAVLIGVQFWHADRGGVYVLWYLPLVLLMVFRPTLTGHEPPVVVSGEGGVFRWAGSAWRRVRPARAATSSNELAV